MFDVTLDGIDELQGSWADAQAAISDGVHRGVCMAVEEGLEEARRSHRYKDRTGDLTRTGFWTILLWEPGRAEAQICWPMAYASFVENGTAAHVIRPKEGYGFVGPLHEGQSRRAKTDIGTHRVALRWYDEPGTHTGVHFARVVHHPGTAPYPFAGPAYLKAERVVVREIEASFAKAAEIMRQ